VYDVTVPNNNLFCSCVVYDLTVPIKNKCSCIKKHVVIQCMMQRYLTTKKSL
jgi:hypothetical protein